MRTCTESGRYRVRTAAMWSALRLPRRRAQVRDTLMTEYGKRGININSGCSPKEIKKNSDGSLELVYSTPDDGEATKTFDQILMATGRAPNTEGLGLDAAGVSVNKGGCAAAAAAAAALRVAASFRSRASFYQRQRAARPLQSQNCRTLRRCSSSRCQIGHALPGNQVVTSCVERSVRLRACASHGCCKLRL